jgi:5-methylcytosine-specific restriction endonuclease McrA
MVTITTRPRRRCTTPWCGGIATRGGKCPSCRTAADRDRKTGSIYNTPRWKALRKRVLEDEPVCRICRAEPSTQADHIIPIEEGGDPWDLHNLQGLGASCHSRKTNAERHWRPSRPSR